MVPVANPLWLASPSSQCRPEPRTPDSDARHQLQLGLRSEKHYTSALLRVFSCSVTKTLSQSVAAPVCLGGPTSNGQIEPCWTWLEKLKSSTDTNSKRKNVPQKCFISRKTTRPTRKRPKFLFLVLAHCVLWSPRSSVGVGVVCASSCCVDIFRNSSTNPFSDHLARVLCTQISFHLVNKT